MAPVADISAAQGRVGLPAPMAELAARDWDAVVVGGGHNGLTAAAYLAMAGQAVLVLERRERLGGACTLERPFEDEGYAVSPCAYVVGLLDERVVRELDLKRHGYRVFIADPSLWCPFDDGTSYADFLDGERTRSHLLAQGFAAGDVEGLFAYGDLFNRIRVALRKGGRDAWAGSSPSRAEIEAMLGGDEEMIATVFEASITEVIDRYVVSPKLRDALFGQGIIGSYVGPHDPGTASVHLMHSLGDLEGTGPNWGYVEGGMGRVSFAIAQAAQEAGAALAAGAPVARIVPGEGVELESGELIRARRVICNADPGRALGMLADGGVPAEYRERLEAWRTRCPVIKLNAALSRLPSFAAAPTPAESRDSGSDAVEPHRGMVTITGGVDACQAAFEACERGEPAIGWAELYFQTAHDPTVAPPGRHTMSAFTQYAPYELAAGDWDSRRDEIGRMILDAIAVHAPDVHDCVEFFEVLGGPDIERRIGLTGGNIFQGEVLPDQMWEGRFDHRTPVEGLYLCGAATHPAGSVIALNGRNAAVAVLEDAGVPAPP
jgi:phytoene dehydrogenase-like protein